MLYLVALALDQTGAAQTHLSVCIRLTRRNDRQPYVWPVAAGKDTWLVAPSCDEEKTPHHLVSSGGDAYEKREYIASTFPRSTAGLHPPNYNKQVHR